MRIKSVLSTLNLRSHCAIDFRRVTPLDKCNQLSRVGENYGKEELQT
jgi:hypothetical protein